MQFDSLNNYRQSASFCSVKGFDIAYWQSTAPKENAPWLCFIHGFPSASWDWQSQWRALCADYNLIACDLLGFGVSDKPKNHAYTIVEQAEIVLKVLDRRSIQQCHIVAHDYGVSVAQELLSKHASRILSICFLNGGLFAESHRPILTQKLLKSFLGPLLVKSMRKASLHKGFKKVFSQQRPPKQSEIDMLWSLLSYKKGTLALPKLLQYIDERAIHRDRWVDAMQSANVPIGFINGVQDPVSGAHMLKQFQYLFPNYPCVGIDFGHYPQLEDPQQVNALIAAFLSYGHFDS